MLASIPAAAEIRLPHVISDHAVLQRDQPVRIWGWAGYGEHISVTLHDQKVDTVADQNGKWEAWLRPERAGGPYVLHITGDATAAPIERTDILMGDVWLASGQSNMEMPLKGFATAPIKDSEKEIAAANYPKIRLLVQTKRTAAAPIGDTDNVWTLCTPETAKDFSAVAYFFGRKIHQEENVPIGLIDTTWGGTPAHAWISAEGIGWANLDSVALDGGRIARVGSDADAIRENQKIQDEQMKAAGKTPPTHARNQGDPYKSWTPSTLYNGMVAPFVNYTVKGFLWYQGETDHEGLKALSYSRVFPALIQDWRRQWGEGPLPFFYVQLASYKSDEGFSIVRDAQRRTLELVNTGMAVTLDVGLPTNIHPPDKQTVGGRLAQSALGITYGHKIETASPLFVEATTEGPAIRAWFSHAEGLRTADATPGDFEVAGADGKWAPATAKIEKIGAVETVVATAPGVPAPQKIRYGWNGVVTSYLYNAGGLPMGTFTSESDAQMLVR
jgi:sialate O-acetylesterase